MGDIITSRACMTTAGASELSDGDEVNWSRTLKRSNRHHQPAGDKGKAAERGYISEFQTGKGHYVEAT